MIDFTGEGVVAAPPDRVAAVVADLGTYPQWLGIVLAAVPDDGPDGPEPAWLVDIGGRLGPFARTKRLRMVRTADGTGFERRERDDSRPHSPWHLAFSTSPADVENTEHGATRVVMRLRYGGGLPLPGVDRLLAQEVKRALPRLAALANAAR